MRIMPPKKSKYNVVFHFPLLFFLSIFFFFIFFCSYRLPISRTGLRLLHGLEFVHAGGLVLLVGLVRLGKLAAVQRRLQLLADVEQLLLRPLQLLLKRRSVLMVPCEARRGRRKEKTKQNKKQD